MIGLTPSQLNKINSKTDEKRTDILRRQITNRVPLELKDGTTFIVADILAGFAAIDQFEIDSKPFLLIGENGLIVKSSNLAKSKVFGGGSGGAGGGTIQTAIVEAAQCVWVQALLRNGEATSMNYITDDMLRAAFDSVDVGSTTIRDILTISEEWRRSSYISAQALIDLRYAHDRMMFHRGSRSVKDIYARKGIAFANDGLSRFSDDKWNPADIWGIVDNKDVRSISTTGIDRLNASVLELFNERKVVGISLKKVNKIAKIDEYNVTESRRKLHTITGIFLHSKRGTFWSTKGGYIVFDEGVLEFRSNSYMGTNKLELKDTNARGGSIGWNILVEFASQSMNISLPTHCELKQLAVSIQDSAPGDVLYMYDLVSVLYPNMTQYEFESSIAEKDAGWIVAKLGALIVSVAICKSQCSIRFVNDVINYARSSSKESGAFVKVHEL